MGGHKDHGGWDRNVVLAGSVSPAPDVQVSAAFFHRTLAGWLGRPEGQPARGKARAAPHWAYGIWKAEVVLEGAENSLPSPPGGVKSRRIFTARVFRTACAAPEVYRYWLTLDDDGRVRSSGWLTAAPNLLDTGVRGGGPEDDSHTCASATLAALYADAEPEPR